MSLLELPMRSDLKGYKLKIDLDVVTYTLRIRYNERAGFWVADLADALEADLVNGIPLQSNIDLIQYIKKLGVPEGNFLLVDESGENKDAGEDDLGNDVKLLYLEAL